MKERKERKEGIVTADRWRKREDEVRIKSRRIKRKTQSREGKGMKGGRQESIRV